MRPLSDQIHAIQSLPIYERLPGEYHVIQNSGTKDSADDICRALEIAGEFPVAYRNVDNDAWHVWVDSLYRRHDIAAGCYVTFRREPDLADPPDPSQPGVGGGTKWSVISYSQEDFESRYRRVAP